MPLTLFIAEPSSVPFIGASPPSWMCAMLLAAKELEHELVPLDFSAGEHRSPNMLAHNPRGTIPVLVDGEAVIHETFAILDYLEWKQPGHLPQEAPARALALTRFHESSELKAAGMRALAYLMRTSEDLRDPEVLRRDGEHLAAELDRWEGYLSGEEDAPYFAGPAPSLADVAVFPYVATLRQLGLALHRWPKLEDHFEHVSALTAALTTRPTSWSEPAHTCPWPI